MLQWNTYPELDSLNYFSFHMSDVQLCVCVFSFAYFLILNLPKYYISFASLVGCVSYNYSLSQEKFHFAVSLLTSLPISSSIVLYLWVCSNCFFFCFIIFILKFHWMLSVHRTALYSSVLRWWSYFCSCCHKLWTNLHVAVHFVTVHYDKSDSVSTCWWMFHSLKRSAESHHFVCFELTVHQLHVKMQLTKGWRSIHLDFTSVISTHNSVVISQHSSCVGTNMWSEKR